jgi:putative restriction endonuclease
MKAVFDTRADSGYDDDAPERYHFPGRYLEAAKRALGDWFIYRAPRRGGGQTGYFAVARLDRIEPDKVMQNHYFGTISNYFPFDEVVPLRHEGGMFEQQFELVGSPLRLGAAMQGKSIRTISEIEFGVIVRAGLDETLLPANGIRLSL